MGMAFLFGLQIYRRGRVCDECRGSTQSVQNPERSKIGALFIRKYGHDVFVDCRFLLFSVFVVWY